MRDILIISIVLVAALMTFRRPWIGVMLWTWISIMNPHRYAYGFAYTAPIAMIAAASTLIALFVTRERQSPFKGAAVWWLLIFTLLMTISWILGADPTGDYNQWSKVIKIYLMTFVALALLNNKYHILAFTWVTVGSLALLGAKGGVFTIIHGGTFRVWGPPGSFIEDNNEFALSLIIIVPLIHFLQRQLHSGWQKHIMSILMLLCVSASLGSQSRGALLALIAMSTLFWLRTHQKGAVAFFLIIVVIVLLPMMPDTWWSRMDTIQTYQEDGSAMGRINAWHVAWEVAKSRFFGAGMSYQHELFFSAYGIYEQTVRAAHSIYFQILGNHGFIGLISFLFIWISTYRTAGWLRKNAKNIPEAKWASDLGSMVQVGLFGYAVGGAFLSLAYFDLPYNMMVMVVLAKTWVETKGWERDPKISFLEYSGFGRNKSDPSYRSNLKYK